MNFKVELENNQQKENNENENIGDSKEAKEVNEEKAMEDVE